jgi:hypothetical protein
MLKTQLTKLLACCAPFIAAPAFAAAPAAPAPAVQDDPDEEKPDKRPEIKEMISTMLEHAGKKGGKEDRQAVELIDKLLQEFPDSGKKDRKDIVNALAKCFKEKRTENDEGVRDNQLFLASAVALGQMGPESVSVLDEWIGKKPHKQDLALQRQLILSLGKTKDEKAIKSLVDLLTDKYPAVQGATAEALGNFADVEQKQRKFVFEEILKVLNAIKDSVDADVNNREARERYDVIAAPMVTTLQALTGESIRDPSEWRHWWNKNKKKNWDEE